MSEKNTFMLDSRLQQDMAFIVSLGLSELLLMNDKRWPWLILVPRIAGAEEVHSLPRLQQAQLMEEISTVAAALRDVTGCEKINIGALGNIVRQLHIHLIARNSGDANWPNPVWGFGRREPYTGTAVQDIVARIQARCG
ncbi:MAG: Histidine triad (HIT) protein [Candidatus Tokpelaia hoelldobleri]|uniref:Histidine triad (HIT) protein n=1 Tax=Candidatus Tokpelaia hoelldobleri TaxID=1902579 RepID=A0A1U9JSY8_9HYPH|nr:MAG: Histidine triad (HIT) protein [Candidatus Tokpelaia hoelldoblerii]